MNKIILILCFVVAGCAAMNAQERNTSMSPDQTPMLKTEMKKLDAMIGKWSGDGWIQQGARREEFTGTEIVQRKIDGLALLIEGRFTDKKDSSKVIHETLAVLNYNPKSNIYDFKTYLASGRGGDFTFKIAGAGYEWGLDFPDSKIVYTITIKNSVWNEVGKISRDGGKTWLQFFEMNLKKT